jgi:hypothetical protein
MCCMSLKKKNEQRLTTDEERNENKFSYFKDKENFFSFKNNKIDAL